MDLQTQSYATIINYSLIITSLFFLGGGGGGGNLPLYLFETEPLPHPLRKVGELQL